MSRLTRCLLAVLGVLLVSGVASAVQYPQGPDIGDDGLVLMELTADDDHRPPIELPRPPGETDPVEMMSEGKLDNVTARGAVGGALAVAPGGGAVSTTKERIDRSLRKLTKKLR